MSKRSAIEELQLESARWEAVLETARDAVISIDQEGRITLFNRAAEQMFGYAADEVLGEKVNLLMPLPYRAEHDGYLSSYRATGAPQAIGRIRDVEGLRKNGEVFPIELSVSEARVGDNVLYSAILRDVSAVRRAGAELRESEERYRALFENTHDLIQVVAADGTFLFTNSGWRTALGYDEDEIERLNVLDIVHPDSRAEYEASIARVMGGEPARHVAARFLAKDGRVLEVEGGLTPHVVEGRVVARQGIYRDVTEQRAAERRLQSRHAQQAMLARLGRLALERTPAELMDEVVVAVAEALGVEHVKILELLPDRSGLLLRAGVGWRDGLVGQLTVGAGTDSQAGFTLSVGAPVVVEDLAAETRFRGPLLLAEHGVVSGMSVPIDGDHGFYGVLGVHTRTRRSFTGDDVNMLHSVAHVVGEAVERGRAERALAEARKTAAQRERLADVGGLAARIVHDVGNPLAGLSMSAQALRRKIERDPGAPLETAQDSIDRILTTVGRLDRLIGEFKQFLREQKLDLSEIVLPEFLGELVGHWRSEAEERGIELSLEGAGSLPRLRADGDKLRRVLDNLVKNALEAVDHGPGEVRVSACRLDGEVRICVDDSGPGMPEGIDPFALFETTKPTGTGLGLPIVKQLVEAHGGRLCFTPHAPRGTRFVLDLPLGGPVPAG